MRHLVFFLLSGVVASAAGLAVAYAVFSLPVLIGKPDFMLLWGWIGWLPAMLAAYVAGSFVYHGVAALLERRPILDGLRRAITTGLRAPSSQKRFGNFAAWALLAVFAFYVLLVVFSA